MVGLREKLVRILDDGAMQLLDTCSAGIDWEKVEKELHACEQGGIHRTFEIYERDGEQAAQEYRTADLKRLLIMRVVAEGVSITP
jgi:hypothetical protein